MISMFNGYKTILPVVLLVNVTFSTSGIDLEKIKFDISINHRGELTVIYDFRETSESHAEYGKLTFNFGMPPRPAERVWIEDDILWLQWKENSIIYTMNVFLTSTGEEANITKGTVLTLRLHGENTDTEYKEARAGFIIFENKKSLVFDFTEGLISLKKENRTFHICTIEIPAGCHVIKKNDAFEFSGNMPPGTTGFMVFKIPVRKFLETREMVKLYSLDYEDCLNLFKKMRKNTKLPAWHRTNGNFYLIFQ